MNPQMQAEFVECDLANLNSVKNAGDRIAASTDRLDLVFCNAGIMAHPPGLSKDGYEIQFATNHLGHALLVKKLLPVLQSIAQQPNSDVRLIFNTSLGFKIAKTIQFDTLNTTQRLMGYGQWVRYGQSKLANILYPSELSREYPDIIWVSIHPGIINTGLIGNLSLLNRLFTHVTTYGKQSTLEDGVKNQLWAASVSKSNINNGAYYEPVGQLGEHNQASKDTALAKRLREWTADALKSF